LPKRWGHPLHSMCSYLAMFPPALPRYFIEQCSRPGDLVLDPFSGRGTAPLEACLAGRVGIGSDANPLAALLTHAKVDPPALEEALGRLAELRRTYRRLPAGSAVPSEISMLFDGRRTLPQLLHLRKELAIASRTDRFLLAALAGILHGNHPQDPRQAITLSISMPNTFSMSPAYIRRYIHAQRLRKYPFDAFDSLERRVRRLFRTPPPEVHGRAARRDARTVAAWLPEESVSLIVTSPPYLRVVRYGKFNWIRLWLLGESVEEVDRHLRVEATDRRLRLSDQLRLPAYCDFLAATIDQCAQVLKPGGTAIIVIGDVDLTDGTSINLAGEVWRHIRRSVGLQVVDILEDRLDLDTKVTRIWGSRRGNATKVDRVLILRKPGGRRCSPRAPRSVMAELTS
jgi:DNA modification methylase